MLNQLHTGIIFIFITALMGCASNVNVDYDKSVNFSHLKSYKLLPKSEKSTADTRLDSPLVDKRIVNAINANMQQKGFIKAEENPDILVRYQLDVKLEIDSRGSGVSMIFGAGTRGSGIGLAYSVPSADVQSHDRGILTIDFLSGKNSQLVWRGTSSRRLYDASTPESSEELINSIVQEIMNAYPPK
jgi:hypothetical protein